MLTSPPIAPNPPIAATKSPRHAAGEVVATVAHDTDPDMEDIALLARGDTGALGRLYDRYARTIFAAVYQLLLDAAAAEDTVQDTFIRAWRNAASYQPRRGSVRSWLISIARHAAIDHLRARSVAQRYQPTLARQESFITSDDPAVMCVMSADAQQLRSALGALPYDQRQPIELAFFFGLTHQEIATRTGLPLGTVKGRVRLGLRRLRDTLGESGAALSPRVRQPATAQPVQPTRQ